MTYYNDLVAKLSHDTIKDTCCRLAFLSAVVKIDGSIHLSSKKINLELKISNVALARHVVKELKSLFGLSSNLNLRKTNLKGLTQSQIIIKSDPGLKLALEKLEIMKNDRPNFGIPTSLINRTCCKRYFLRGAFMAGGYLNQSSKTAHLEITSENTSFIDDLSKMLEQKNIKSTVRKRGNYHSLYIKDRDDVTKLLKLMEASNEALEFENSAIIKNIKNRANRLANAETANKNKVIKNAFRQIKEIGEIENNIGLSSLSARLQEICLARLENPQASLARLGEMLDPPIEKSAVNHRLRRVREIAKSMRLSDKSQGN